MHMHHFQISTMTRNCVVREITHEEFKKYRKFVCYRTSCTDLCEHDICHKYGKGGDFKWSDDVVTINESGFECYVPND